MARPKHSLNATEAERKRIRDLFRQGIRIADIAWLTKRSRTTVDRTVRGMKRKRLTRRPNAKISRRNRLIVQRVTKEGQSMGAVARRFHLTHTRVWQIVHADQQPPPGNFVVRTKPTKHPPAKHGLASQQPLTRAQRIRRNTTIVRLVTAGMSLRAVARRYGLTETMIRLLVQRAKANR